MRRGNRVLLATALVVAAAFYRTIDFWTRNAWDLASPAKILLIGAVIALVAVATLMLLLKMGLDPMTGGFAVGGLLMLFNHWQQLPGSTGLALVGVVLILARFSHRAGAKGYLEWLGIAAVTAFGIVPVVQLIATHVASSTPYRLVDLPSPKPATASGVIEDVVFVIVDTYPNLHIAENWFGHRPDELIEYLDSRGFTVAPSAWSRHTFTSLSVSGILELTSVITAGTTEPWGNRSSLWHILRGDNLVSQTLESAGFRYTHIESGWEGTACGPEVDRCIQSPWLDEQVWGLLAPTIALDWIKEQNHFYTGTLNSAAALQEELPILLDNGSRDYVFAHFLMPHAPFLADETCQLRAGFDERFEDKESQWAAFADQMECVDRLLMSAIVADDDTAVLLTGDHGSSMGEQVYRAPSGWSDADIAERFGVFTAYTMPPECGSPSIPDPTAIMNAILSCAVDDEFDSPPPRYLIGAEDPQFVEPERMERIQAQVEADSFPPPE